MLSSITGSLQRRKCYPEKVNLPRKSSGLLKFLNIGKICGSYSETRGNRPTAQVIGALDLPTTNNNLVIKEQPGPFRYIPETKFCDTEYPQPLLDILDLDASPSVETEHIDILDDETLYASDDIESFLRMYEDTMDVDTLDTDTMDHNILDELLREEAKKIVGIEVAAESPDLDGEAVGDDISSIDDLISAGRTSTPFEEELSETTAFSTYELVTDADIHIYKHYSTKNLLYISNNVIKPQFNNMLQSNSQIS